MALLWFVKPLLAVYGFVYQKMYGVVAVAQGSAYCCSQFSKFYTLLDATGSTHFCLCWSVVLRKIGSVMSSSCCYVRGRACVRECACVWVSHLSTFERADRFSPTLRCEHRRATQCRVFFYFFFIFWRVRKIAKNDYELRHVCPSARLSVPVQQLGSHWTEFHEILHLSIFRKSVEQIQFWLKSDKNNGHFT